VKRREFITFLGGAGATWPLAARAQQDGPMRRIGWLTRDQRSFRVGNMIVSRLALSAILVIIASQASSQEQSKLPRIGVLMTGSEVSSRIQLNGLRKGLVDAGIAEGSGVVLDIRYADGKVDQLHALAADLVKSRPAVLFTGGDQGASAVKRAAMGQLPIVAVTCDALAAGLVSNLAAPWRKSVRSDVY